MATPPGDPVHTTARPGEELPGRAGRDRRRRARRRRRPPRRTQRRRAAVRDARGLPGLDRPHGRELLGIGLTTFTVGVEGDVEPARNPGGRALGSRGVSGDAVADQPPAARASRAGGAPEAGL